MIPAFPGGDPVPFPIYPVPKGWRIRDGEKLLSVDFETWVRHKRRNPLVTDLAAGELAKQRVLSALTYLSDSETDGLTVREEWLQLFFPEIYQALTRHGRFVSVNYFQGYGMTLCFNEFPRPYVATWEI